MLRYQTTTSRASLTVRFFSRSRKGTESGLKQPPHFGLPSFKLTVLMVLRIGITFGLQAQCAQYTPSSTALALEFEEFSESLQMPNALLHNQKGTQKS